MFPVGPLCGGVLPQSVRACHVEALEGRLGGGRRGEEPYKIFGDGCETVNGEILIAAGRDKT